MVQVIKTQTNLYLIIFHSIKTNIIWFAFSTSKQLENTLFQKFICSHTSETITNQLFRSDKVMLHIIKMHIILCLMIFHSTKSKN